MKTNRTNQLGKKVALGVLIAAGALLSSCTYNEVMKQRNAEGEYLRGELDKENARGAELRSQTPN